MTPAETFAAAVQAILERLLTDTGASRTTLRLDEPSLGFRMVEVVAEALASGQPSMKGESTINHRAAGTGLWLEENRRLLVQDDLSRTEFAAPVALTGGFGVKAQMLAPVERDGRLEGWVSIHEAKATRPWSPAPRPPELRRSHHPSRDAPETIMRHILNRRHALMLLGAGGAAAVGRSASAAPASLDAFKAAKVMKIGVEAAYVPFTYRDNTSKIVGFDIDAITAYLKPIGIVPEFIDTQWSGIIPALQSGRFEMVPTMSYTKERLERVLFSRPYADASQALLIRARDKDRIRTIEDMSGLVLGNKLGSAGATLQPRLEERLKAARGAGFKDVKIYDDHPAAYLALAQGTVDGVLNTLPTLGVVLRDRPTTYALVRDVGPKNSHGYAFRKEDTELAAFFDKRIGEMMASGELAALQDKWFGFRMDVPEAIPSF